MGTRLLSREQQDTISSFDKKMEEAAPILDELRNAISDSKEKLEGNVMFLHNSLTPNSDKTKQYNLFSLASESRNALEIGFNAGHSALIMLLANPELSITSVDIGTHRYARPCYRILRNHFPERVNVIFGDSQQVLPALRHNSKLFDLIHIDGSHNQSTANHDIHNALLLAVNNAYVVLDDTQKPHISELWECYSKRSNVILPKLNIHPCPNMANSKHDIGVFNGDYLLLGNVFMQKHESIKKEAAAAHKKKAMLKKKQKYRTRLRLFYTR